MKIGPKFKLARRLGAPVFEKTQTQKYALSLSRRERAGTLKQRPKSEFGQQLIEKQKARFTYGITEKQFANYVKKALTWTKPADKLFSFLEWRLDNALYRAGFTKTRAQARQAASHGHITVNGKRVTIPSIQLKPGDKIGIRAGSSAASRLFEEVGERMKSQTAPAWIKANAVERTAEVVGEPVYTAGEQVFDLGTVIEFYSR